MRNTRIRYEKAARRAAPKAPKQAAQKAAPAADRGLNPSTTVVNFDRPLAPGTRGFALGDVDAEKVQVTAYDAAGNRVPASALGFQSAFNFCESGTPRPSSRTGPDDTDVPHWDPASSYLVGNVTDTNGAAGWFHPTARVATLEHANCTVTYTPDPGFTGQDSFTLRVVTADGRTLVRSFDVKVARTLPVTGAPGGLPAEAAAAVALLGAGAALTAATRGACKA